MSIKKAFAPIMSVLSAALAAGTVAQEVHDEVLGLASAKSGAGGGKATTFHRTEDGRVVAVFCYYFKRWFNVIDMEFGEKKSSASGLNSMCKQGMSLWTKQNNAAKKAQQDLLTKVGSGEIAADEIPAALEAINEEAKSVKPVEGEYQGFETLEDCLADLEARHG